MMLGTAGKEGVFVVGVTTIFSLCVAFPSPVLWCGSPGCRVSVLLSFAMMQVGQTYSLFSFFRCSWYISRAVGGCFVFFCVSVLFVMIGGGRPSWGFRSFSGQFSLLLV